MVKIEYEMFLLLVGLVIFQKEFISIVNTFQKLKERAQMTRSFKTRKTFDFQIPINVILSFENLLIVV